MPGTIFQNIKRFSPKAANFSYLVLNKITFKNHSIPKLLPIVKKKDKPQHSFTHS